MPEGDSPLRPRATLPGRRLGAVAAATLIAAATVAGCGFGGGEGEGGTASLDVTRDFGAGQVAEIAVEEPSETDTVVRVLDRETEIETRHGGGFVHSIEGIAGGTEDGRSVDWFFYVNGIESDRGAADVRLEAGDRVWWDYRDWSTAMRVPAVVGSWPAPFASRAAEGEVEVGCATRRPACEQVADRLEAEGAATSIVELERASRPGEALRVLVGPWRDLRADAGARPIEAGPAESGVFARIEGEGSAIVALDARGEVAWSGSGGMVAATAAGDGSPTWVVTGTGRDEVADAVLALDASALRRRYAVAVRSEAIEPLPARGDPSG